MFEKLLATRRRSPVECCIADRCAWTRIYTPDKKNGGDSRVGIAADVRRVAAPRKPNSVRRTDVLGARRATISLGRALPRDLKQPTRGVVFDASPGLRPGASGCSAYLVLLPVGFAVPPCHHPRGALLPHHFTLTWRMAGEDRQSRAPPACTPPGGIFLLHFPSDCSASPLSSTVPVVGGSQFGLSSSRRGEPGRDRLGGRNVINTTIRRAGLFKCGAKAGLVRRLARGILGGPEGARDVMSMSPPDQDLLRSIPLFAQLSAEDREALAMLLKPRTFAANEPIFWIGERGDEMFIVQHGQGPAVVHGRGGARRDAGAGRAGRVLWRAVAPRRRAADGDGPGGDAKRRCFPSTARGFTSFSRSTPRRRCT